MPAEKVAAEKLENWEAEIVDFLYYIRRSDWGYNQEEATRILEGLGLDPAAPEFQ